MKHKSKNQRKNPFQTSKKRRPHPRADGVLVGGEEMGVESDLLSIIEIMMNDVVDQGGTISVNEKDGRLSISAKTSGTNLYDDTWKEEEQ